MNGHNGGEKPRTILVTGAPRSGTTAVGELLSGSPGAIELYEPMSNIVGDKAVSDWFPIPGQPNFTFEMADDLVDRIKRRRVRNTYRPENILGTLGRNRFLNRSRRTAILARLQPWKPVQIWKDPMALMMVPRIVQTTDIPVIVTVRDHLSLSSSFKRMNWRPPVESLVTRMQSLGLGMDPRILELITGKLDAARAGAVAWNLFYTVLLSDLRRGMDATIILNTDLMLHAGKVRQRLIDVTGLSVPRPERAVNEQPGSAEPLPEKAHIQNRSLSSITDYWKKTLDDDQVAFSRDLNDALWTELEAEITRRRQAW